MIDYTLVVGVDHYHLQQLSVTWPTWKRHKPDLLQRPMVVFFDRDQVKRTSILEAIDHPDIKTVAWPEYDWIIYDGDPSDKWTNPQRYRMLSGFVHVPATHVDTKYWLKLDTDTVATGKPDWIQDEWFANEPAIVAQRWSFTKPPDQMLKLDQWVADYAGHVPGLSTMPALNMAPQPGSDRLGHKRIISWCGFFHTATTALAARYADRTVGANQLPVPSQDGYLFYVAKRMGLEIKRIDAKAAGWEHWTSMNNVVQAAQRAMQC